MSENVEDAVVPSTVTLVPRRNETAPPSAKDIGTLGSTESAESIPTVTASATNFREAFVQSRQARGWGPKYEPRTQDEDARKQFRRLCDDLETDLKQLDQFVVEGVVTDEGAGTAAEIQASLERLYHCPFGQSESLKSIVVAIQSQINNAIWTERHVAFLKEAVGVLRPRYVVSQETAEDIFEMIEEHGLDQFRGSLSDTGVRVRYRLEKVEGP